MEKLFQGLNKHRIWGYEIFSVPLYLFLFLAIMVFAANQMDVIPGWFHWSNVCHRYHHG